MYSILLIRLETEPKTAALVAIRNIHIYQYDPRYFLVLHVPSRFATGRAYVYHTSHHMEVYFPQNRHDDCEQQRMIKPANTEIPNEKIFS